MSDLKYNIKLISYHIRYFLENTIRNFFLIIFKSIVGRLENYRQIISLYLLAPSLSSSNSSMCRLFSFVIFSSSTFFFSIGPMLSSFSSDPELRDSLIGIEINGSFVKPGELSLFSADFLEPLKKY